MTDHGVIDIFFGLIEIKQMSEGLPILRSPLQKLVPGKNGPICVMPNFFTFKGKATKDSKLIFNFRF